MIGVLVCGDCSARWTWAGDAPERPGQLRCSDCGGPLAFDRPTDYFPSGRRPIRIPHRLGLPLTAQAKRLRKILAEPGRTRWLKQVARFDLDRLVRRGVGGTRQAVEEIV